MEANEYLDHFYEETMTLVGSDNAIKSDLPKNITSLLDTILEKSESAKAVITVVLTSVVYKILNPEQDIRNHQSSIENGYSGRTFDTKYITPFLKNAKFP